MKGCYFFFHRYKVVASIMDGLILLMECEKCGRKVWYE